MPPAGSLGSAGVTPPHRYYRPIRQALAFPRLRLLGSPGYLASVVFLHGARSPSLFQTHGLVRVPPLSTPPGGRPAGRFRNPLLPSPLLGQLGDPEPQLTEPQPSVHSSLRPAHSLTLPSRALSMGFTRGDLPLQCHPSYAASTSCRFRTFTLRTHEYLQASPNVGETPASLGITVGRWKVRTDGSREGFDDVERASRPRAGG